ncbi:MAG: hypothetical protein H6624_11700 [Bdellovibrionaceae bacterium]|nr:hypothetical protein [Bdellovibrionales bacterium]MCB9085004.1 hypothetical protein [Pseudobdellovibrionaceae bacterium]
MEKIYQINDQFEIEVLIETNDRFESIRQICVKDPKNRLADNYQPNRLVVEEHDLFMVIWDRTNKEPVSFSGIYNGGRYPGDVARFANRSYVFPNYRAVANARTSRPWVYAMMLPLQEKLNPMKRKLGFISVGERLGKSGRKVNVLERNPPEGWLASKELVRVCNGKVYDCVQRVLYKELLPGYRFDDWNAERMDEETWLRRVRGEGL